MSAVFFARLFALCLLGGANSLIHAEAVRLLDELNWLQGEWVSKETGRTREVWHKIGPKTWEGEGARRDPETGLWRETESLRLVEMGNAVYYLAKVPGNPLPVAFKLVEVDESTARFENPQHDFPQFLVYQRTGTELFVEAGAKGRESLRFHFQFSAPSAP